MLVENLRSLWLTSWTIEPTLVLSIVLGAILLGSVLSPKQKSVAVHAVQYIKKRGLAWAYLWRGPTIIKEAFLKSDGKPFEIHAPDTRMLFVSSPEHIKELDRAPDHVLSLNGAAKHMLQPLYTMNGFNWFDKRGVEGVGFVRTLRTLLTNNLPKLLPDLSMLTSTRWAEMLANKPTENGTIYAAVYPMMMELVVLLNARSLFGTDLIQDKTFMTSALGYVEETLLNAEIVKLLPEFLRPTVGGVLSRCLNSHKIFFKSLIPATEQRIQDQDARNLGHDVPKHTDCIQWIIETAPKQNPWSAERVIYELMAIWFGSVHILSTTIVYVLHDLCLHPEYIEPIRKELAASYSEFERTGQGLPLLDSFMKESARLTPVESMAVRRCALQPFTLSTGDKIAPGEWTCAPSGAINVSSEYYPSPDTFSGFRFIDPSNLPEVDGGVSSQSGLPQQPKPSKITDVDHSFLMWGTGRMACPGRYYATAFMKVVIAQIIMNYDIALVNPNAARWIPWRVAKIPRPWTKLAFTPRA